MKWFERRLVRKQSVATMLPLVSSPALSHALGLHDRPQRCGQSPAQGALEHLQAEGGVARPPADLRVLPQGGQVGQLALGLLQGLGKPVVGDLQARLPCAGELELLLELPERGLTLERILVERHLQDRASLRLPWS